MGEKFSEKKNYKSFYFTKIAKYIKLIFKKYNKNKGSLNVITNNFKKSMYQRVQMILYFNQLPHNIKVINIMFNISGWKLKVLEISHQV